MNLGAVLTAIVTPFDAQGRVNEAAFVALMRHLGDNGSDGFVVAGTTGEASTLTDEEQLNLIGLAARERPPGKSIVAGTGTNDTRHAVHLTERASELGADAMLSVTPYYNKPSRLGLKRHYEAIAKATDKPIVLYNIPGRTATNVPPDLLAELAQIDGVEGVKQANAAELQPVEGLELYAGQVKEMIRRFRAGDTEAARQLDDELAPSYELIGVVTGPIQIKAALNLLGHDVGGLRLPLVEATEEEREAVRSMLLRHGLLDGEQAASPSAAGAPAPPVQARSA